MRDDRKAVFTAIREALGAGRAEQLPGGRLAVPTVPTAARLTGAEGVASFKRRLEAEHGDLSHVASWQELPAAVASRIKAAGYGGPLYISRDK
ncbi:MAG: hypothetical protein V3R73_03110, partial [Sphingomonadales bacterium]